MLTFDVSILFSELRPEIKDRILRTSSRVSLQPGEWLFEQDDYADMLYIIKEGKMSLIKKFDGELMDRLPVLGKGEIIGWSALVPPHDYTMGAIAEEETVLLAFNGEKMLKIMNEDKETGYFILKNISELIGDRLVNICTQMMSLKV
jgi:CRP-like cAMP-binding protein